MDTNAKERYARYRARHPEDVKRRTADWKKRHPEQARLIQQRYYKRNQVKIKARRKAYRARRKEFIKQRLAAWRATHQLHIKQWREDYIKSGRSAAQRRASHKRIRLEIMNHYGGDPPRCACCSEHNYEFLSIDHINGGGRQHVIALHNAGKDFYRWLFHNNFPPGYRVLCYNCNFARGHYGYCPHENQKLDFGNVVRLI